MEIELEDGTVLDAPDGLSPTQIKSLVFNYKTKQPKVDAVSAVPVGKYTPEAQAGAKEYLDRMRAPSNPGWVTWAQGAMQGYGDELGGAVEALKAMSLTGGDPHRAMFEPGAYTKGRDRAREAIGYAEKVAPTGAKMAGNLSSGIPLAMATGGASLPSAMGVGGLEGAINAYGETEGNDWKAVKDMAIGAGLGAAGGAAGYGVGKLIEKFTSRGLAAATIQQALDKGDIDGLIAQAQRAGMTPAEMDDVLKEVLRGQAAKNPTAAAAVLPAAQQRMADVNAQTVSDIDSLLSPDNAARLIADLQKRGQQLGDAGYKAAYSNPATVGLLPEIANNPAMADAVKAAQKLAEAQGRTFDITNLGVQDLDALERALRTYASKAFESTPENTLMGPVYKDLAGDIGGIATNMSPELAATRAGYATVKTAQEATELGQQALNPSKEFVQVADEFANLAPDAQEAYKAGMATKLRTILQQKSPTSNAGAAINKEAVIEKLKAVGFPDDAIDAIIKRGQGSRGVLDALVGGSDTARKLAAAAASESPMSKIKPQDLMVGALVHPATLGIMPALRAGGTAQERSAAEMLIKALASQNPYLLQQLMRTAPQQLTPFLGAGGAALGSASQTGLPR